MELINVITETPETPLALGDFTSPTARQNSSYRQLNALRTFLNSLCPGEFVAGRAAVQHRDKSTYFDATVAAEFFPHTSKADYWIEISAGGNPPDGHNVGDLWFTLINGQDSNPLTRIGRVLMDAWGKNELGVNRLSEAQALDKIHVFKRAQTEVAMALLSEMLESARKG